MAWNSNLLLRQALLSALAELPLGGSHTLLTCLREWETGRLPNVHLVSFVRSIAWQSPALYYLRNLGEAHSSPAELLSPDDMQALQSGRVWGEGAARRFTAPEY